MRFVDIYRNSGNYLLPAAMNCIQTGDVQIQRRPILRSYTMANGAYCIYPATLDTAECILSLECTQAQAIAIGEVVRYGEMIVGGARIPAQMHSGVLANPATHGFVCQVTGTVQIEEKFACTGIYTVRIPLRLCMTGSGAYDTQVLPVVDFSALSFDGRAESLSNYTYSRGGIYERKSVLFTDTAELSAAFAFTLPDVPYTGTWLVYAENDHPQQPYMGNGTEGSCTVQLAPGANELRLVFRCENPTYTKPLMLRLTVYRNGVST